MKTLVNQVSIFASCWRRISNHQTPSSEAKSNDYILIEFTILSWRNNSQLSRTIRNSQEQFESKNSGHRWAYIYMQVAMAAPFLFVSGNRGAWAQMYRMWVLWDNRVHVKLACPGLPLVRTWPSRGSKKRNQNATPTCYPLRFTPAHLSHFESYVFPKTCWHHEQFSSAVPTE